ncbi:Unknown protein [Striga hermonthica]|uniref:Uncharacterized protein n=1 Tax=Striga hermonthica TaxID=68872 RepID=A0A9N7NQ91_STRHE|nr:Unknown protein [Striga hermonthica]
MAKSRAGPRQVVENRVKLLKELEESGVREKSAVNSLFECLAILWEEFTCLDISQCMLNKAILDVAAKYLDSDISGCLVQFLALGTKANMWSRKHMKMTLMSMEDSPEEEHSSFFYQLVLDLLNYTVASYSALARYTVSFNEELVVGLENFISEQFSLMTDLVSEIKRIHTLGSELLKAAQFALDAVTRLCKVYCSGVKWDIFHENSDDAKTGHCRELERVDHVIRVTNCTIEKLCEMGTVAANDGGSLVSVLNLSWKGVVSLLQFGKGALATKVNIRDVIMNLISLASESLRRAAETWLSSVKDNVPVAEAKRIFLPIKFYLINAVRIISQYQTQSTCLYRDIALFVVMISSFKISLSTMEHLRSASDVLAETLEPTSLHLINSLLNSSQVKQENKCQILDWLFRKGNDSGGEMTSEAEGNKNRDNSLDVIFCLSSDSLNKEKMIALGRVALFLRLLICAPDLEDDTILLIAQKLGWLLDILVDEDVYCATLVLQIPMASGPNQTNEVAYHPMFCAVLHAMKTFLIVASLSVAWNEVESFLIENLFHPHFLCWDIITELWCFILRHAEMYLVNDIVDKLCALLMLTSGESVLFPQSALRNTARLMCTVVSHGPEFMVDRVYHSIFDGGRSENALNMQIALLMEGFPLNFLSEKKRSIAKQRIITEYYDFLESFAELSLGERNSSVYGAPVFALCAALQSLQVSLSDVDMKTLKFLVSMIHKYKTSPDNASKNQYRMLLGELLGIISNLKHLYSSDEMDKVIVELQKLFISSPATQSDSHLLMCKPNLSHFMAGLGHADLPDGDDCARSSAAWELYHMLLRERHWALVHLSVSAFGYFAARTSCNQLWRFVPHDAALSFDLDSGKEADEERFMSELKVVLEKDVAACQATPEQLVGEGLVLREKVRNRVGAMVCDAMDVEEWREESRKRKIRDGISKGVGLLQDGLRVMVDGLSEWERNQHAEVHEEFQTHFCRLEDVIGHLVRISDRF